MGVYQKMSDFLSIGIPAYNEEESIARMLESVFSSTLWKETPAGMKEVIVCCNGCTDSTEAIVKRIMREHEEGAVKLLLTAKGKPKAWKEILKRSDKRANVIYFADADVILHRGALERLSTAFRRERFDIVAARPRPVNSRGRTPAKLVAKYHGRFFRKDLWKAGVSGGLYGISRKFAESVNMPDNIIADDAFLQLSAKKVQYVSDAKVFFFQPRNLHGVVQQKVRWIAGRKQLEELGLVPPPSMVQKSLLQRLPSLKKFTTAEKIGGAISYAMRGAAIIPAKRMLKSGNPSGWNKVHSTKHPKRTRTLRRK